MPSKIFSIRPAKFLTTFLSVVKFQDNSLPSVLPHAPVTTFVSSFFAIYLLFFTKTGPLDAPKMDARGRRTVRTPCARH